MGHKVKKCSFMRVEEEKDDDDEDQTSNSLFSLRYSNRRKNQQGSGLVRVSSLIDSRFTLKYTIVKVSKVFEVICNGNQ
jgi:hypothetical protein